MQALVRKERSDEPQEKMTLRKKDGVEYLTFPALDLYDDLINAFSTRTGGVSEGVYSTLNFSYTRGDNALDVTENYRRMARAIGVDMDRMAATWQTHTTNVRVITEDDCGKGVLRERDYRDVDGLITNIPGITLVAFFADCVPLYFFDPVHKAIGLSHSGWRGTVARMGQVTLEKMKSEYGTRPDDVTVCIGPSICRDCYEVGEDVIDMFRQSFSPDELRLMYDEKADGKYQLDLWQANRTVLEDAGVSPSSIHVTDICTRCNPELIFSHRFQGDKRGNSAAFLCLKA